MPTTITSYSDFKTYIDKILNDNNNNINGAPHGAFWDNMTEEQFLTGNVPGIPNAVRICIPGNGKGSNIVQALQGVGLFTGTPYPQMPADGPPYFTAAQIQPIIDWIDSLPAQPTVSRARKLKAGRR